MKKPRVIKIDEPQMHSKDFWEKWIALAKRNKGKEGISTPEEVVEMARRDGYYFILEDEEKNNG